MPLKIDARIHDLGGLQIRRVLPFAKSGATKRHVGPFVFLDHIGPIETTKPMFVPEHPHIGLATATYLFDGEILHKDSLGSDQVIRPGELNLMTAGQWITHIEQGLTRSVHGLQFWLALPQTHETMDPRFQHLGHELLPKWERDGIQYRLLLGTLEGRVSKADFPSRALFATLECQSPSSASKLVNLATSEQELGLYLAAGECAIRLGDEAVELKVGQLLVLNKEKGPIRLDASFDSGAKLAIFGGDSLDGERLMKWNYVASRKELIDAAEKRWELEVNQE